jgi:hypothetical protein
LGTLFPPQLRTLGLDVRVKPPPNDPPAALVRELVLPDLLKALAVYQLGLGERCPHAPIAILSEWELVIYGTPPRIA